MDELKFTICSDNKALASSIEFYLNSINSFKIRKYVITTLIQHSPISKFPPTANKIVEEKGIILNIKNSIGNLFFEYLIDDSDTNVKSILISSGFYPRIKSTDMTFFLREIRAIINIYDEFKKIIEKIFEVENYKIIWNDFELENINTTDKKRIYLFNIQSGTKYWWEKLTEQFFTLGLIENFLVVFYYYDNDCADKCNKRLNFETFENEDKLFGYSRFIRDFLIEKKIAICVQANDPDLEQLLREEINYINWEEIKPKTYFQEQMNRINFSLNKVYGVNFSPHVLSKVQKRLSEFYQFNKNSFASSLSDLQIDLLSEDSKKELSSSVSSHSIMNEYEQQISKFPCDKNKYNDYYLDGGKIQFWNHFRKSLSALIRSLIAFKKYNDKLSAPDFLFLDDNFKPLIPKLEVLKEWFPQSKIQYVENFEWKNFYKHKKLIDTEIGNIIAVGEEKNSEFAKTISKIKPDFLVIDLDYKGQLVGYDLLRRLRSEIKQITEKVTYLIVLSRYEDPYVIRTAINNGALLYITKSNFLRLIYKIYHLNFDYSNEHKKYHNYENWQLLSKLEPSKIARLKSEKILGIEYDFKKNLDRWDSEQYKYSKDYQWIKKLPKADLHCHIGSCMGPDLLPQTAALVLAEKYRTDKKVNEKINSILDFLIPIALDPYLNEVNNNSSQIHPLTEEYKANFKLGDKDIEKQSLFQIISSNYDFEAKAINPETAILDPTDTILDRLIPVEKKKDSKYFQKKWFLRDNGISYDEILLFFILLLSIREKGSINNKEKTEDHLSDIKEFLVYILPNIDSDIQVTYDDVKNLYQIIEKYLEINFLNNFFLGLKPYSKNLIRFLQSAHSINRCIPDKGEITKEKASLFNYLRGCEYAGAAHLQTKAAIYCTADYIIKKYARKENIRYIDLRCAVDGYSRMNMQTKEVALEALLRGLDYFSNKSCSEGFKIHINVIITAKRHKSLKAFDENVELTLKYRYGLDISEKSREQRSFFPSFSKVVSFDLAGIEKGNRPSKFYQHFLPLLRQCFPITIHAGEEDDYESIWEAIYLVQSQRIGHGLTLRQNEDLLKIVRERHITIELCPLSNLLTNSNEGYTPIESKEIENYLKNDDKEKYWAKIKEKTSYPLRQYLDENLDVSINTDNPFVNDAALTQEYLVAAKLVGGLTKWEILRIVKNGFKGVAVSKQEKRKLMDEIDDEIFELMLNEES